MIIIQKRETKHASQQDKITYQHISKLLLKKLILKRIERL